MSKPSKSLLGLSVDSDFLEKIKEQALAKNYDKPSPFVYDWLKRLALDRNDVKRVILLVPEEVFGDRDSLEEWLASKCNGIVDHYFGKKD